MPISDGARKDFNSQKHFKGREVFIGLDTAVTLGHPTTIAVGLLLILHHVNSGEHAAGQ